MEKVFLEILNRGIAAGWLVLVVAVLRLFFRKAPKKYFVILWALVGLRLLIPFSLQSVLSLVPSTKTVTQEALTAREPAIQSGITAVDQMVNPVIGSALAPKAGGAAGTSSSPTPAQKLAFAAGIVWIAGTAVMFLYAFFSWLRIRLKVQASQEAGAGIRVCDYVDTPFILGVFHPLIYLPSALKEEDRAYVIAHERAHLARHDNLWKPLGFLLLAVFWFNPLLWLAYILLCRDIEFACDEKVLAQFGESKKKAYASVLLNCSIPHRMISASPLAFGETGIKNRIKNVLRFHRVKAGIIAAAVILCIAAAVCFLTDPVKKQIDIAKEEVAYIEYDSHDSNRTFQARYEDAPQQIDALIDELNGDYTYVKKNWSFRHWNTSGYGVDEVRFYGKDGTLLEEVQFINDGYVLEPAFLGEREYKNVNGILSTDTIRACFADGPWNKYERSAQEIVQSVIYSYCGDLYELASHTSYRTVEREDYASIHGYITARVIQARGKAAESEYSPGIRKVWVQEVEIRSLQPETGEPQTAEADIICQAYYENDGRKEEWRDRLQFVLEPNGNSFRITDIVPVLGDDFLLIEDFLRAEAGASFEGDPSDNVYEEVDDLVKLLYHKGATTPVPVQDVLTGEICYYTTKQTVSTSDGRYSLIKAQLWDRNMKLVEESKDSTYSFCLGACVIKENFEAMSSQDPEKWMEGTCLYDPVSKTVKLEGLSVLYKLTEDRAVAVNARAQLMGVLNGDAEMIIPYEGEEDLYVAAVEDGVIILVDEGWEKEVRLDADLKPLGEE